MKNLKIFPYVLLLFISICSCNRTYVYPVSDSYDLKSLSNKSVTLVGTDGLLLKGFKKTFNEKYENVHVFKNNYINLFKHQLNLNSHFNRIDVDTTSGWNLIKSFAGSKEDFLIMDSLFAQNNSDYIINIHYLEISNRFKNNTGTDANGNAMTTRRETCMVNARFQIIDRIARKPMLEFESSGEKGVSFFNHSTTLEKAMLNSIEHAVHYIQTGETKFKK